MSPQPSMCVFFLSLSLTKNKSLSVTSSKFLYNVLHPTRMEIFSLGMSVGNAADRVLTVVSLYPRLELKPLIYFIGPFNSQKRRTFATTNLSRTKTN